MTKRFIKVEGIVAFEGKQENWAYPTGDYDDRTNMTHHTPKRIGHVYVPQNIASQIAEMQNEIKELSLQVESLKETVKTCQETIEQLIYHPKSPFIQDVRDDWERRALDLDKKSI